MNVFQTNQNCYFDAFMKQNHQDINPKLFDAQEAIMLGNLFKELYMSWNGFSNYCLQPENRRQQALLEVQMFDFVAHEINLYLDTHPKNQRMIQLYHEYVDKANQARENFEKEFGPLFVTNSQSENNFDWIKGPWPWDYQC